MRSIIWMMAFLPLAAIDEAGAQSRPGTRDIGIFDCFYCQLRIPQPDPSTMNEMKAARKDFDARQYDPSLRIVPGDVITMCNATVCAEYVVTVDGVGYKGLNRKPQTPAPPGSGGGGGGGGGDSGRGGRGGGPVGDCIGKCTGRVWVGKREG